MITTKQELYEYLKADAALYPKVSSGIFKCIKNRLVTTPQSTQWKIFSYIRHLRYAEYYKGKSFFNNHVSFSSIFGTICLLYHYWYLRKLSFETGIQIDPNTFGKGLRIFHFGAIVVNAKARVGSYATIYPGVLIGAKSDGVPTIENHCFIGAGSKILGG